MSVIIFTEHFFCVLYSFLTYIHLVFVTLPWDRNSFYSHFLQVRTWKCCKERLFTNDPHWERGRGGFWTNLVPDPTLITNTHYCILSVVVTFLFYLIAKHFFPYFEYVQKKFMNVFSQCVKTLQVKKCLHRTTLCTVPWRYCKMALGSRSQGPTKEGPVGSYFLMHDKWDFRRNAIKPLSWLMLETTQAQRALVLRLSVHCLIKTE
jgi:hypothetical protein